MAFAGKGIADANLSALRSLKDAGEIVNSRDFPAICRHNRSRARPAEAEGEGGWTQPPGLTINRRSLAPCRAVPG